MRFRRLLLILLMGFALPSMMTSCASSGEEQQEDLIEGGEQAAMEGNQEGAANFAEENNFGDEQFLNNQGNQLGGNEFQENFANEGGQNEGELQEIIEDLNGANANEFADNGGLNNDPLAANGNQFNDPLGANPVANDPFNQNALNQGMAEQVPMNEAIANGGDMANMANPVMDEPMEQQTAAATGSPLAPGLPELGSKMHYIVQKGDTLAKIATRVYGDPSKWSEIANFTGIANPRLIYPGDVVYYQLSEQTMAFASAYESVTRAEVQVMEGDTLATIASRVLGDANSWKSIWRENDTISNPDKLVVGSTLYYIQPGAMSAAVEGAKQMIFDGVDAGVKIAVNAVNQINSLGADMQIDDTVHGSFQGLGKKLDGFNGPQAEKTV